MGTSPDFQPADAKVALGFMMSTTQTVGALAVSVGGEKYSVAGLREESDGKDRVTCAVFKERKFVSQFQIAENGDVTLLQGSEEPLPTALLAAFRMGDKIAHNDAIALIRTVPKNPNSDVVQVARILRDALKAPSPEARTNLLRTLDPEPLDSLRLAEVESVLMQQSFRFQGVSEDRTWTLSDDDTTIAMMHFAKGIVIAVDSFPTGAEDPTYFSLHKINLALVDPSGNFMLPRAAATGSIAFDNLVSGVEYHFAKREP